MCENYWPVCTCMHIDGLTNYMYVPQGLVIVHIFNRTHSNSCLRNKETPNYAHINWYQYMILRTIADHSTIMPPTPHDGSGLDITSKLNAIDRFLDSLNMTFWSWNFQRILCSAFCAFSIRKVEAMKSGVKSRKVKEEKNQKYR